jgi:hypothetical protein
VSFSSASHWDVGGPTPGGPFCGYLMAQLAQPAYFEELIRDELLKECSLGDP